MIPVIDLFAGPGGLGEGFSSLRDGRGNPVFQIVLSVEKERDAHKTLRLRSYVRKLLQLDGALPVEYMRYMERHDEQSFEALIGHSPALWEAAGQEALCAELKQGDYTLAETGRERLGACGAERTTPWVLIGGPPCQAYSIVGRARRAHDSELDNDVKQELYKCYLAFIEELKPTVFVMENVKGLLSARHKGEGLFGRICDDMRHLGYEICSLVTDNPQSPRDYVVRAEEYGIPQKRHRVILLGIRSEGVARPDVLRPKKEIVLQEALAGIPRLRSDFSSRSQDMRSISWEAYVKNAAIRLESTEEGAELAAILDRVVSAELPTKTRAAAVTGPAGRYDGWYRGRLDGAVLVNHESRSHLASDLDRYLFCAAYAEKYHTPAHIGDFPRALYPNHRNVQNLVEGEEMKFADRFRVQLAGAPSTTITSHIAKDGHYYIHPQPEQCRSLTVREAARLQTFPDDYLFEGNRTAQYTQVGNAVPPLLAQQVAKVVSSYLGVEGTGFCDVLEGATACAGEGDAGIPLF